MSVLTAQRQASSPVPVNYLHGVPVRPPGGAAHADATAPAALEHAVDAPGLVRVVIAGRLVGVVATTAPHARLAASQVAAAWTRHVDAGGAAVPDPQATPLATASAAAAGKGPPGDARTYVWPRDAETDAGAWVIARCHEHGLGIWTNGRHSHAMVQELGALLDLAPEQIQVWTTGEGRADVYDAAADAALLANAVKRPVRVMAGQADSRDHDPTLRMRARAGMSADGRLERYELEVDQSPWCRPSIARMLASGAQSPSWHTVPSTFPYDVAHGVVQADGAGAWGAAPGSAWQNAGLVFANESLVDELAHARGEDPVAFRLRHLGDPRAAALVRRVAEKAGWHSALAAHPNERVGRGFALSTMVDPRVLPPRRTWSAWVVEVGVDATGAVRTDRVVVGHESAELSTPPAASGHIEQDVQRELLRIQGTMAYDDWQRDTPAAGRSDLAPAPGVELVGSAGLAGPGEALAWDGSALLPAAAAVANAVFDATGVRLREPPFQAPGVRERLAQPGRRGQARMSRWLGGALVAGVAAVAAVMPWPRAIAPLSAPPVATLYSADTIERGRLIAAAGNCMVCHTGPDGVPNTGGRSLETPFGAIVTTNITPAPRTGIGLWSLAAFTRAMREGVGQDGRQLYPAFPYTSFAKMSDADVEALYAYLMSRPAVENDNLATTRLRFPFNVRPLMAGWNLLHLDRQRYEPDASRSPAWNRGKYLVDGVGHCGACHTPRSVLGAEKSGAGAYLAGARIDGWEAPALDGTSRAPLRWTQEDFFQYLRDGFSPRHGVAAGPMAPVVRNLAALSDYDIRAMATYLVSLDPAGATREASTALGASARGAVALLPGSPGERTFQGACASCHEPGQGPTLFGVKPSLAVNTSLHSDRPDNLVQVILHGIEDPAHVELGHMPAYRDSLTDGQIEDLAVYMRRRFAPERPAWADIAATVKALRTTH